MMWGVDGTRRERRDLFRVETLLAEENKLKEGLREMTRGKPLHKLFVCAEECVFLSHYFVS